MPQLDVSTFLNQFFWLCISFFFLFILVDNHIAPKMARILKYRKDKMIDIQMRSSFYASETETQQQTRWARFQTLLNFQKQLGQTSGEKQKEKLQETWEMEMFLNIQQPWDKAYVHINQNYRKMVVDENGSIAFFILMRGQQHSLSCFPPGKQRVIAQLI